LNFGIWHFILLSLAVEEKNIGIYDEPLIRSFEQACEKYPNRPAIILLNLYPDTLS
jgi:hypothetical protein